MQKYAKQNISLSSSTDAICNIAFHMIAKSIQDRYLFLCSVNVYFIVVYISLAVFYNTPPLHIHPWMIIA